jgi:predicted ribosome quality control (RQC) complex YloA/Tae2 family protein
VPPPDQPKLDPRAVDAGWARSLRAQAPPASPLAPLLVRELRGISPQVARELAHRAAGAVDAPVGALADDRALPDALADVLAPLVRHDWSPRLYRRDGQPAAFSPFPLRSLADLTEEPSDSVSATIETFYGSARAVTGHGQSKSRLLERLSAERDRVAARRRALDEQLRAAEAAERLRESGEMIYAFMHTLAPGQTRLELDGLSIELDPRQSPVENAQAYFERYRRARSAAANLPQLVESTDLELAYLDQLLAFAGLAEGLDEIQAIEAEWQERATASPPSRRRPTGRAARRLRTPRGDQILIGRNGRQNDEVTFDLAGPNDLWLHARGLPGAHVILQPRGGTGEPEDRLIEAAAQLAAYYSPARGATAVEVDVTPRRWVRKVKGGPPGLVTYRNEYTVRVAPQSEALLRERGLLAPERG